MPEPTAEPVVEEPVKIQCPSYRFVIFIVFQCHCYCWCYFSVRTLDDDSDFFPGSPLSEDNLAPNANFGNNDGYDDRE